MHTGWAAASRQHRRYGVWLRYASSRQQTVADWISASCRLSRSRHALPIPTEECYLLAGNFPIMSLGKVLVWAATYIANGSYRVYGMWSLHCNLRVFVLLSPVQLLLTRSYLYPINELMPIDERFDKRLHKTGPVSWFFFARFWTLMPVVTANRRASRFTIYWSRGYDRQRCYATDLAQSSRYFGLMLEIALGEK
jgi:hypothetical protein